MLITRYRWKTHRFQKEILRTWILSAAKQKSLRRQEKEARKAVRACRMANGLELCSIGLAQHYLSQANEYLKLIESQRANCVPISKRVDVLLESFQHKKLGADGADKFAISPDVRIEANQSNGWNETDMEVATSMKKLDAILSQSKNSKGVLREIGGRLLNRDQLPSQGLASFFNNLRSHLDQSYSVDDDAAIDPSILPQVKTLDLEKLADVVQKLRNVTKRVQPQVRSNLRDQKYIMTGLEDDPLWGIYSGKDDYNNNNMGSEHSNMVGNKRNSMDVDFDNDLDILFDNNEHIMSDYLRELNNFKANAYKEGQTHFNDDEPNSLVDSITMTASNTLTAIQQDAAQSNLHIRSSQLHLTNYDEYIEKKTKQRVQCIRDITIHCCTCRGPHISKPPFTHVKGDYRREPTHVHRQGEKCLFLKKKRNELRWLGDVLSKYGNNRERFEKEIQNRQIDAEIRKEELRGTLANTLMLMDMALP